MTITVADNEHVLEMADGTIHTFRNHDSSGGNDWRLESIRDRYGHELALAYIDTATGRDVVLTDSRGREHRIVFVDPNEPDPVHPGFGLLVDRVVLETFGGQPATYELTHANLAMEQCYRNTNPDVPINDLIVSPVLTEVILPADGGTYVPGTRYATTCGSEEEGIPGALGALTLPTKGELEWDYGKYWLPGAVGPMWQVVSGVVARRMRARSGSLFGERFLTNEIISTGAPTSRPVETRTYVRYSEGDCTKHYFRGEPGQWDAGLPYSIVEGSGGPGTGLYFKSTEVWSGWQPEPGVPGGPAFTCATDHLRTSWVQYEDDGIGVDSNRRLARDATVFEDDAGWFIETQRQLFDGLGHYRNTLEGGASGAGFRATVLNYNPGRDWVPGVDYNMIRVDEPWILDTFASRTVESNQAGDRSAESLCYDENGFVERRHRWHSGSVDASTASNDVVIEYERSTNPAFPDLLGQVIAERYYGGDVQTLNTANNPCEVVLSGPWYEIRHEYQHGVRSKSTWVDGASPVLVTMNLTIDQSTGLATRSRDASEFATDFAYDKLGRLTVVAPEEGARTEYEYVRADASAAKVIVRQYPSGGGALLTWSRVDFGDFGRVNAEFKKIPTDSGTVVARKITNTNARGWKTSVSEWHRPGQPVHTTQFLLHDPFGRPGKIRPPDGSVHDVDLDYWGIREIHRTVRVGTGQGLAPSLTREFYDRFGRLTDIHVPVEDEDDDYTEWSYRYDHRDRLINVYRGELIGVGHVAFHYDPLGNLWNEHTTEVSNGGHDYGTFDPLGNPRISKKVTEGWETVHGHALEYDKAGRITRVDELRTDPADNRPLKEFVYGTVNGANNNRRMGKLWKAIRHNYVDDDLQNPDPDDYTITELYAYKGLGGRISNRTIQLNGANLFAQAFSWTELGDPATVTYPWCLGCGAGSGRTISHNYVQGLLTSIPGEANSIVYHPNQMLHRLAHTETLTDVWAKDPNDMRRPASITSAHFQSGTYAYDGAGNITAMGADSFTYDLASRLLSGSVGQFGQSYTYDLYGNLLSVTDLPGGTTRHYPVIGNRLANPPGCWPNCPGPAYTPFGSLSQIADIRLEWDRSSVMRRIRNTGGTFSERYIYTADDERIAILDEVDDVTWWRVRGLDGKVLREWTVADADQNGTYEWAWSKDYIYRDGTLLASDSPTGGRHFHLDHLGTIRAASLSGGGLASLHDYFPYGEVAMETNGDEPMQFTGHERDLGTFGAYGDLDYMHARYCSPHFGTFLSVDPAGGSVTASATWNKYAYALGNPLRFVDPDGLEAIDPILLQFFELFFGTSFASTELTLDSPLPPENEYIAAAATIPGRNEVFMGPKASNNYRKKSAFGIALLGHELQHLQDAAEIETIVDTVVSYFSKTGGFSLSPDESSATEEAADHTQDLIRDLLRKNPAIASKLSEGQRLDARDAQAIQKFVRSRVRARVRLREGEVVVEYVLE